MGRSWDRQECVFDCAALDHLTLLEGHQRALRSVEAAIDPYHNLDVGAGILAECFRTLGDWWAAIGCYHAPGNAERAARYRERVKRIWSRVTAIG